MGNTAASGRAIAVVRVSEVKGREGESFASPLEQAERIGAWCKHQSLELLTPIHNELDVSGGAPLSQRDGLRAAVEAVEAGQADVIVVAYFDRLVRSLKVQDEVVTRVEDAGGRVVTLDVGEVSHKTAGQWLSSTMIGAVSEYYRRSVKERTGEAQKRAVARGVLPFPNIPPGYRRGEDGVLVVEPAEADIMREAYAMRDRPEDERATIADVRAFLQANGIHYSYHGVQHLLQSTVYVGEIHFGELENLIAHEAIIDRAVWDRVQRFRVTRGRKAKSERLLARLGVLRCGTCDARLVVGTQTQNGRSYPFYRCPPTGDCKRRVTIGGEIVEGVVIERVRKVLADVEGRASAESNAREVELAHERAQADLDAAIRAFAGLADEQSARERIAELVSIRDAARADADHLRGQTAGIVINGAEDWDRLTLDARRALIRATIKRVTIAAGGRGADRISVKLIG